MLVPASVVAKSGTDEIVDEIVDGTTLLDGSNQRTPTFSEASEKSSEKSSRKSSEESSGKSSEIDDPKQTDLKVNTNLLDSSDREESSGE